MRLFCASSISGMEGSVKRFLVCFLVLLALFIALAFTSSRFLNKRDFTQGFPIPDRHSADAISKINAEFAEHWKSKGIKPLPPASAETLVRRLSLSLTGAVPSLSELKRLNNTDCEPSGKVSVWLNQLTGDERYANYMAERLARVYVGVETGPFLVYRRRRMVNWLSEQLLINRPYDEMVRDMISAEGIWTSQPEANFITVSIDQNNNKNGPDEVKLAARTSRAFLGVSLDCMQCHDDMFGDHWKQTHFHGLAAFYSQSEMSLTGVRENEKINYETRFVRDKEASPVQPAAPFQEELLPEDGNLRERLAVWVTHSENKAFARAMVNRAWALLLGKPLIDPVNDIPLEGPYPPGMEILTDEFIASGFDLHHLYYLIANSAPFLRSSKSEESISEDQEENWAAFPVTPLRPEQVIGSVIQTSSLAALDEESHIINKLRRSAEVRNFVKQFGDQGEEELQLSPGTIPQRLLLMNSKMIEERIKPNPFQNSSTRIAMHAPDAVTAISNAFLTVLTRQPSEEEKNHFVELYENAGKEQRQQVLSDLYWALINSTEFSWNR